MHLESSNSSEKITLNESIQSIKNIDSSVTVEEILNSPIKLSQFLDLVSHSFEDKSDIQKAGKQSPFKGQIISPFQITKLKQALNTTHETALFGGVRIESGQLQPERIREVNLDYKNKMSKIYPWFDDGDNFDGKFVKNTLVVRTIESDGKLHSYLGLVAPQNLGLPIEVLPGIPCDKHGNACINQLDIKSSDREGKTFMAKNYEGLVKIIMGGYQATAVSFGTRIFALARSDKKGQAMSNLLRVFHFEKDPISYIKYPGVNDSETGEPIIWQIMVSNEESIKKVNEEISTHMKKGPINLLDQIEPFLNKYVSAKDLSQADGSFNPVNSI
jgi:hypothetical protein